MSRSSWGLPSGSALAARSGSLAGCGASSAGSEAKSQGLARNYAAPNVLLGRGRQSALGGRVVFTKGPIRSEGPCMLVAAVKFSGSLVGTGSQFRHFKPHSVWLPCPPTCTPHIALQQLAAQMLHSTKSLKIQYSAPSVHNGKPATIAISYAEFFQELARWISAA